MKVNISMEEIFGDKIKERREREAEHRPNIAWFSNLDPDKLLTCMPKYDFGSFESIPPDHSGLTFPAFEDIHFTVPQVGFQRSPAKVVYVDGLKFLSSLGSGAFCIDPRRWHKIKTYIAKGEVEYPQACSEEFGVSDGRHRTLLLMQLYNRRTVPVVISEAHYDTFMTAAKNCGAV
jgi:hypothetical protein